MSTGIDNEQVAGEQEIGLPGLELKNAREGKGLKPEDIASRLNLEVSVIVALETDNYAQLPEPTYIRGYILAYTKLLGLPESVLKSFDRQFDLSSPLRSTNTASSGLRGQNGWVKCISGGLIILLVIVVGLWFTENSFHLIDRITLSQWHQAEEIPASPEADDPITQATDHNAEIPTVVMDLEKAAVAAQRDTTPMPEGSSTDDSTAIATDLQQPAPVPADEATTGSDQPEPVGDATATTTDVVLVLKGISWIEVHDTDGELQAGTFDDGQRIELNGVSPIRVTLGRPENVELTYRGRPIDLAPYHGKVARLTLDDQIE